MSNVQDYATVDVGVSPTQNFEAIQFGLRWLGMPLDRVALGIRRRCAVVELDDSRSDESREFGSCPIQADIARLGMS